MNPEHYIVFDFYEMEYANSAIVLEEKLNELGKRGYLLLDSYSVAPNKQRFLMEHKGARQ